MRRSIGSIAGDRLVRWIGWTSLLLTLSLPAQATAFVAESTCVGCHAEQHRAWSDSQHARAMQPATPQTVLADFGDRRLQHGGQRWRFHREGARYLVQTDGPDGRTGVFEVRYTFGVSPLQQYLAATPGGRLQALPWAWDVRRQAWFHLQPEATGLDHRHPLHWTALPYNANTNCIECHTTGYRKAYDAVSDRYASAWHQGNVGCQACHGPAAGHLAWAGVTVGPDTAAPPSPPSTASGTTSQRGFSLDLRRADPPAQTETCARCHALREPLGDPAPAGPRLMDSHLPALLGPGLYFTDGQQQDEVFIYGSWLQSRMHAAGVRCADCHEPHGARPRAADNALCTRCHNAAGTGAPPHVAVGGLQLRDYDTFEHHGHRAGSPGSRCVDCHAPARTYMRVDPRRDHAFSVPRPDLAVALGLPDACSACHADRGAAWAASVLAQRRGGPPPPHPVATMATAFAQGRSAGPGAVAGLLALVDDRARPAIVRATALDLLQAYPGAALVQRQVQALGDGDPMVRRVGASGAAALPPAARWRALAPLLQDPVRAVRLEAARLLAGLGRLGSAAERDALERALAEFGNGLRQQADKPTALFALGNLYRDRGEVDAAQAAWRSALRLDARFVPALVNLADLLRLRGRDREGEQLLSRAVATPAPGESAPDARLVDALVLTRVRLGDVAGARALVDGAAGRPSAPARLGYLEALLLDAQGRRLQAMAALQTLRARHPADRDSLLQLAAWHREAGDTGSAVALTTELRAINPWDPALERR